MNNVKIELSAIKNQNADLKIKQNCIAFLLWADSYSIETKVLKKPNVCIHTYISINCVYKSKRFIASVCADLVILTDYEKNIVAEPIYRINIEMVQKVIN